MKVFRGTRTENGTTVTVEENGSSRPLDPRLDVRAHSRTGFEWSYSGSGPAQLALALATEVLGDVERAQDVYQTLKFCLVSRLPENEWILTGHEVLSAISEIESRCGWMR